jgi:quinol-cytochrome oxidoreductase complex cytochrome b subunit
MSGQSTYTPKSGLEKWIDQRLPLPRLMHDTMTTFPTPRNLNIWYTFGGILTFCLGVQIVSGIVLAMHYVANANMAFDSVESIMRDVNYGWLIRYIHSTGASMFFLAVYIHMFRGLYYGSYKAPRELIWIIGVLIYVLMMATAFFGYVLPWGQMSFWGATVITNLFSSIDQVVPHLGTAVTTWLWGDFAVGDATLNRFFSLHYLLPFIIAGVVGLHIWALHVPGNNNPLGIDVKSPQDTVPFHPYYTVKDAFYLCCFVVVFAIFVFYAPNFFGNPDNYQQANPLVTPPDIVPEWYLLPFYAMLRSVPQKLLGVLVLGASMVTLVFIPWLDTSRVRSCRFRPLMKQFFWAFAVDAVLLGYCGSQGVDATAFGIPLVWVARLGTFYYFAYFWVLMPIIGLIETPKKLPASIAQSVLGEPAAAPAE